jgi:hypothetical protein
MLKWLLRRRIAAFRRTWGYDTSYMEEILATSLLAATRFAAVQRLAHHREDLPAEAGFAAGLVTLMAEDCGPCVQLVVKIAEAAGTDPAVLHAILARVARLPADARLSFRFAEATRRD